MEAKTEKCKENVWGGWRYHPCLRSAVRDGYCKQHHPDTVKARREAADKRFAAKMANSPYVRIADERDAAQKEIAALKAELAVARSVRMPKDMRLQLV